MHTVKLPKATPPSPPTHELLTQLLCSQFWRQTRQHVEAYLVFRAALRKNDREITAPLLAWTLFHQCTVAHNITPIESCDVIAEILMQLPQPEAKDAKKKDAEP